MEAEFDIQAASETLGNDLFGSSDESSEAVESTLPDSTELGTEETDVVPEVQAEETEVPPAETQEETATQIPGAPKTWRKEAAAVFETLPDIVKAEVMKREEDMFKGMEQYKQGAQIGQNFQNVIAPHLDHLQRAGVNPYEEVNGLLEYSKIMRFGTQGERMQLLSSIATEYGLDLLELAETTPVQPYIDPAVKALQDEVNQLKSGRQQEETQRVTQARAEVQRTVDAFKADPKHEHFDTLEPEMVAFMTSGVCKTLEEAYEKALWANPLTRAKEQARLTAEAQAQSTANAAKAKLAQAANLKTNARPGRETAPTGSMDDTMREQLAAIRSRT